jgi:hypothetical protein
VKRSIFSLALAAAMLVAAPLAHASILNFFVNLSPLNEIPPTNSAGTGTASFVLDTTAQTLEGHIVFSGLSSNTTAAHIHCCLASPFLSGANVGVATLVPAFPGFPLGVTAGSDNFLLDLSLASSYNPGFISAAPQNGSLAVAEANFIDGLISGRTYLNIHTTAFGGGEIRGFVVPEPMTASLLALGLAAAASRSSKLRPRNSVMFIASTSEM